MVSVSFSAFGNVKDLLAPAIGLIMNYVDLVAFDTTQNKIESYGEKPLSEFFIWFEVSGVYYDYMPIIESYPCKANDKHWIQMFGWPLQYVKCMQHCQYYCDLLSPNGK